MIEFEEYKLKLNDLKPKLEALAASLNLDRVRNELERFHAMQEAPGFWDEPDRSQKIVVQTKLLEAKLEKYHAMTAQMEAGDIRKTAAPEQAYRVGKSL